VNPQLTLLDEGWGQGAAKTILSTGPKPTADDMRILLWLKVLGRPATHFQIGWRWGRFAGRDPASAYRALRRLTHGVEPLLDERSIQEPFGNASQTAIWLSRAGADVLQMRGVKHLAAWRSQPLLEAIALTDFELETESSGWVKVSERSVYVALVRQAVARRKHRTLTSTEAHIRDILERTIRRGDCPALPFAGIQHSRTGEVRLVAHVRHGFSIPERLLRMPDIGLLGAIQLCVLGDDAAKVYQIADDVKRWSQRSRNAVVATRVANWRKRENPNRTLNSPTQRYGLNGVAGWDDPSWFCPPEPL